MFNVAMFAALTGFVGAQAATQYGGISVEEINGKKVAIIDGESTESISITEDVVVDSVYYDRAFEKGVTATIMLPFSIDTWRVKDVTCFRYVKVTKDWDGNEWSRAPWVVYITHAYPQVMEANVPYLVVPGKDLKGLSFDISHNVKSVTLNTTTNSKSVDYSDKYGSWNFIGTYDYKQWNEGDSDLGRVFGFAARDVNDIKAGEFVKGKAGIKIRPMRAYLKCMKTNAIGAKSAAMSAIDENEDLPETLDVRIIEDDGTTKLFGTMNTRTGEVKMNQWYDLKGRKMNKKPEVKGSFYNNKVIVK